jgi:hypothetical protein
VYRNLPFMIALALSIFGVAYSKFSGHTINGYWEFLAIAIGIVCVITAWPNAPDRQTRFKLSWTQVAHWVTILCHESFAPPGVSACPACASRGSRFAAAARRRRFSGRHLSAVA